MKEGEGWLPEHSVGLFLHPCTLAESLSPTKPGSGPAPAGWGVSDHTQLTGPLCLMWEP